MLPLVGGGIAFFRSDILVYSFKQFKPKSNLYDNAGFANGYRAIMKKISIFVFVRAVQIFTHGFDQFARVQIRRVIKDHEVFFR